MCLTVKLLIWHLLKLKKKKKEKSDRRYLLPIRNITQQRAEAQCVILLAPYTAGQFGKRFEARRTVGTFSC